jgi:hypothetical protein
VWDGKVEAILESKKYTTQVYLNMILSVYQMLLLDKLKDKSNTGHSTTRSRLSSLTEAPLKHMDWYLLT